MREVIGTLLNVIMNHIATIVLFALAGLLFGGYVSVLGVRGALGGLIMLLLAVFSLVLDDMAAKGELSN